MKGSSTAVLRHRLSALLTSVAVTGAALLTSPPAHSAVLSQVHATNLGIASWGDNIPLEGGRLAFYGVEADQGADLNGDGDALDYVAHVWDPSTASTVNLGLATGQLYGLAGGRLAFPALEYDQGGADLNGDGDTDVFDSSVHIWDPGTNQTTNLGIGAIDTVPFGNGVAFQVMESREGGADLNGDGDIDDFVVHTWDPVAGLRNLRLAMVTDTLTALDGGRLAFLVSESFQDHKDRNGDGSSGDWVLHVWDPAVGTTHNVGLAASSAMLAALDGGDVGFLVPEDDQGGRDRNGDGDATDRVAAVWDPESGTTTDLGLAGESSISQLRSGGAGRFAFTVVEANQGGRDLNDDGDTADRVVHVWDPATGTRNLRLAVGRIGLDLQTVGGSDLAFLVKEADQGGGDLNGDGDARDLVVHVWDGGSAIRNLGLASAGELVELDGGVLAFRVLESDQDGRDLNDDGDHQDGVMYVWDPAGGARNLRISAMDYSALEGGRLAISVWERFEGGADRNGNGDVVDQLVHVWDPVTGTVIDLGYASAMNQPDSLGAGRFSFMVYEAMQYADLNGDGDLSDHVVHVATLTTPPGAPVGLRVVPGDGRVTVSWDPPVFDGAGALTGYTVTAAPTGRTVDTGPGERSVLFDALTNGTEYTFTVRARNALGPGLESARSPVAVPAATVVPDDGGSPPDDTPNGAPPGPANPGLPGPEPGGGADQPAERRSGYWMVGSDGAVFAFGDAAHHGNAMPSVGAGVVDLEPTPAGAGYWLVDDRGRVSTAGDARLFGHADPARLAAGERVTSLSATRSGQGYWIFTSRGRVLTFGDAVFHGDVAAMALNGPVLDSIVTPSGHGYYMVAADGGIFAFGDAEFFGSMGDTPLNAPVQSLVPDPDGTGYWLVASDGGVFSFEAPFRGSLGDRRLNKPVTGMVPYGSGYLMVGEDGGIFNFSDRPFSGSLGANPPAAPIVSVAAMG